LSCLLLGPALAALVVAVYVMTQERVRSRLMRSAQLPLAQYDSDKIKNHYLEVYDPIFQPWVEREIVMLELGVHRGGSLLLWRDYFPRGTIVGVDIDLPEGFEPGERIHLHEGSQDDPTFLSRVADTHAPNGFDIIIDDASHLGELTKKAFWHLFDNHLKPNGLYVIEDWGTGYFDDWPDGKSYDLEPQSPDALPAAERAQVQKTPMRSHNYGMVGFLKQLIDEQGASDVTKGRVTGTPTRRSKFRSIYITPFLVFIIKAER
jgi:hypothetical protein